MIKVSKYESFNKTDLERLLKNHMINKNSVASALNMSRGAISKKGMGKSDQYDLTFPQAFTLYAQLHLNQADFEEILKIMIDDGFEINYE